MRIMDIITCDKPGSGILLEVLADGGLADRLTYDGSPLRTVTPNTTDASQEKHVPIVTRIPGGWRVAVGKAPHPMTPEHWIRFIELRAGRSVYRKFLSPGDPPEASFLVADLVGEVTAVASCNLHGIWSGK